ncbi:MAG TPA: 4-hydroxybenzoate octaprenyltransferase, partial [Planctomycetes bacterium]|nr:4-hydroxybenzoate octaprenyltransferase [Planctomycetota bacterium]
GGIPSARVLALVVLCAVAARTAAMAFNRWLDRDLDRANPRTRGRELPSGVLRPDHVLALVVASSLVFIVGAFALNTLSGWLSFPVLGVLLSYSAVKRFHWLAHGVLGLSLALAPLGAWLAVTGSLEGDLRVPLALAAAVLLWVAGFDLIYSCQDAEHDRKSRLHSIPARFGVARALQLSSLLHLFTVLLLVLVARSAHLSWIFYAVVAVASVLLVVQHRIVRPGDLSRVNVAFFTLNGWVSVVLFLGTALDLAVHSPGGPL